MDNVYTFLKQLGIPFDIHTHKAVFTVEEAKQEKINAEFGDSKNLFLRNRKGDKHYLVTLGASKQLDLTKLGEVLGEKGVGFASEERLKKHLDLTPGSVSPFGLINDIKKEVLFIVDNELFTHDRLGFHPNINTQTIIISSTDFKKYLEAVGNKVMYLDL